MNTRQILKNAGSNYGRTAIQILTTLFLTPYTYRILGPEAFGIWSVSQAIAGYFSLLDIGLTTGSSRYLTHYRALQQWEKMNSVISSSMTCFVGCGVVALLLSVFASMHATQWFSVSAAQANTLTLLVLNVGLIAVIGFSTMIPIQCVIVSQRQDALNMSMLGMQIFSAIATVIGLSMGGGIWVLAILQLISGLMNGVFGYTLTKKYLPQAKFGFGWDILELKTALSFGVMIFFLTSAEKLIFYSDTLVISHFLTVTLVAGYSIVLKVVELMRGVVGAGAGVLGTFIQEQATLGNNEALGRIWFECTRWALALLFPITWVCVFCGNELISSWLGQENRTAAAALGWLSVAQLVDRGQVGAFQVLVNNGKHKTLAMIYLLEAALNLTLSIALVRQYGIVGVAIGTTLPVMLRGLIFFPTLMLRMTKASLSAYLCKAVLVPFAASLPCLLVATTYKFGGLHHGKITFLAMLALAGIVTAAAAWRICLTPAQRLRVRAKSPFGRAFGAA